MSAIITVENVSKKYTISHQRGRRYVALRDVIASKFRNLLSSAASHPSGSEEFWALKDVSFEIKQGERIGIIGRNGAGKSTLLKILSRITEPTAGRIELNGRVASLLEVGTGFHPELTGRENIFLNGAVLGMDKGEIRRKFDEIVAFSEIEKFLDTPVKRYSSGMYVRLAFAVAAHLEPEILIVDEVLAVGDSEFQKKCIGKMEDVSGQGRTVLFVSHNMDVVTRLCSGGILLKQGSIQFTGPASKVVDAYLRSDFGTTARRRWDVPPVPGNDQVRLVEVKVHTEEGTVSESFDITRPIGITMEYEVLTEGDVFTHSINLFNDKGVNILNSHDVTSDIRKYPRQKGLYSATVWVPGNFLSEGAVIVGVAVIKADPFAIYFHERDAVGFNVVDHMRGDSARGNYTLGFPGVVRPLLQWNTIKK